VTVDKAGRESATLPHWFAGLFTREYRLSYIPSLDGLRGFLGLLVLCAHTNINMFSGASMLMEVFFVLSGYLITSLLISEFQKGGSINILRFYRRRLRRLFPALIVMILILSLLSPLYDARYQLTVEEAAVSLLYLRNYYHVFVETGPMLLSIHLWSLAVEEQFYLIWPVVFLILWRQFGPSLALARWLVGIALMVAGLRAYLTYIGVPAPTHIYPAFHMRVDALLIGCALGIAMSIVDLRHHERIVKSLNRFAPVLLLSFISTFLTMGHLSPVYFYIASIAGALGAACFIPALIVGEGTLIQKFFENRLFIFVGQISYGLYLWHWPIFLLLLNNGASLTPLRIMAAWALSFVAAMLSFALLERRFLVRPPRVNASRLAPLRNDQPITAKAS